MTTSDSSVMVQHNGIPDESPAQILEMLMNHTPLYPEHLEAGQRVSLFEYLGIHKAADDAQPSAQGVSLGQQPRPYNFDAVLNFKTSNVHHATCINTKVSSTVGQGFLTDEDKKRRQQMQNPQAQQQPTTMVPFSTGISKASKVLNPICVGTFQQVLTNVAEDFHQVANGYIEIVRGLALDGAVSDTITGIHHLPSRDVFVYVEDNKYNFHYEIVSSQGPLMNRRFARFGDKAGFMARQKSLLPQIGGMADPRSVSEVIHFKNHNALSRWYGFADWLSAVPSIDLSQCIMQQKYDFFLNRGVPEFMLFIMGQKLPVETWKKIENAIKATIGKGNSHKSIAVNIEDPEVKVQLEKLMVEGKSDDNFGTTRESLALDVVTAHRVPPLLAGIQIPGKLGANNELPNALMAFQTLVMGPVQHNFQSTLGDTLGNPMDNGGLALTYDDFELKTILDAIDVGMMSTVGGMRQPVTSATAQGRDVKEGLKD